MLGIFWTIRGEHARLIAMTAAIADAVRDWQPPPELEDTARAALAMTLINAMATVDQRSEPIRELLARLGPGGGDPRLAGMVTMLLEYDPADPAAFPPRLEQLAADPDRDVALPALQWLGHVRENAGDPAAAVEAVEGALALVGDDDGPWTAAMLRTNLADLTMHLGDTAAADEHARAALPVMQRLGATDDVVQLRALLVLCAIAEGRLADAEAELERVDAIDDRGALFGGIAFRQIGAAELALARGDIAAGLRVYRECAAALAALRLPGIEPTGMEPWGVLGESIALVAHAYHATTDADDAYARSAVRHQPRARPAGARPGEPAPRLPRRRPRAVRARRLGPAARRDAGRRRGRAARPRRALRLQPDDPDDGVGADRAARRGARARPDRRAARRASATGGRPSCSTRRAASSSGSPARGGACSCAPPAARRSPSR